MIHKMYNKKIGRKKKKLRKKHKKPCFFQGVSEKHQPGPSERSGYGHLDMEELLLGDLESSEVLGECFCVF